MDTKSKLMIVDDAEINRQILMEILGDGYEYVQAEDGREAVHILQQDLTIDLMLLDINMPHMDGLQVLEQMKKFRWIQEIPVIMISSEERRELMERAYGYGAQDYIRRPFDAFIVRQRVKNTLDLYRTQKHLKQLVSEQIYEKEKNNNLIIGILSHVVEFRNSETSEHILRIRTVTELLLRKLVQKTDEYHLSDADISMITTASALHDIGKINIPEAIINKPGRLTKDEFEIMKTHAAIGGDIILKTSAEKENPLLRVAWQICRWHHERWDGHGYPDGLRGEEIPITAQVVAVADVYDALTSKRCYKDAYAHQTALDMILDGECGSFNPLLLECLQEIAPSLLALTSYDKEENAYRYEADQLAAVILDKTDTSQSNQAQSLLNSMQEKADFLASVCGGIQFSYDVRSGLVDVVDWNKPPKYRHSIVDAFDMAHLHKLSQEDLSCLREAIESTTPENREFAMSVTLKSGNGDRCYDLHARTLWSELSPGRYVEVVGQLSEPNPTSAGIPILDGLTGDGTADGKDLKMALKQLTYVFDIVRLVDPMDGVVLELDDEGILRKTDQHCAAFWENGDTCGNCISTRALLQKTRLNKLEFTRNDMYYVASKYLCIKGIPCVLEMLSKMDEGRWIDANGTRLLINKNSKETRELFLDPVTGAYSRRYLESYLPHLEGMECVDIIDVDKFKHVNDIYGHIAGDMVLREIVAAIQSCIRSTDILVRYGGDEFLLLFPKLTEEQLSERNKKIQGAVEKVVIPEYPGLHLSVSIGGVCDVHPLKDAIAQADKRMYQDKERGKGKGVPMKYEIAGGNLPYVKCRLAAGESIYCESGAMAWMDDCFKMDTQSGGIGKIFGRMFSNEPLFRNRYTAQRDGEIAFASCFPGTIRAVEIRPGQDLIVQKSAYLASETGVDMSIYFQKRLGNAFLGGEGFIMERFSGSGICFLEVDGAAEEYTLAANERKIVSTGNLLAMDASCRMDVQSIGGMKNVLFGGEGFFNTVITGPGRIILQSMPIQVTARALYPYMPNIGSGNGSGNQ